MSTVGLAGLTFLLLKPAKDLGVSSTNWLVCHLFGEFIVVPSKALQFFNSVLADSKMTIVELAGAGLNKVLASLTKRILSMR